MLLRKLVAALCPLLLCLLTCVAFRWLDGMGGLASFFAFVIKGVLLGVCVALILPIAGVSMRTNGLMPWLLGGAGLLLIVVIFQYLQSVNVIHAQLLRSMLTVNGQVLLVEGAVMGYMATMGLMLRRR
ncbi:MAG: hypothetical protein GX096_05830 [Clostridiales bacterium]|nr:hypothetical protein [Clostridiales bacterium]